MDKLMSTSVLVDKLESACIRLLQSGDANSEAGKSYESLRQNAAGDKHLLGRLPDFVLQNTTAKGLLDFFASIEQETPEGIGQLIANQFSIAGDRVSLYFQPKVDKLGDQVLRHGDFEVLELVDLVHAKLRGGHFGESIGVSQRLLDKVLSEYLGSDWTKSENPFVNLIGDDSPLARPTSQVARATGDLVKAILATSVPPNSLSVQDRSHHKRLMRQAEFVANSSLAVIQLVLELTQDDNKPHA